jgi:hypothetical protein
MPIERRKIWTPEDDERLKTMVASGVSLLKGAAALKCTMGAIQVRARRLGTPFPTIREVRKKITGDPASSGRSR